MIRGGGAHSQASDPLSQFHPIVAGWFRRRFGAPTEPQAAGWPEIAAGRDTLIAAPTGSGKTLAAFLACLDRLIRRGLEPLGLSDETEVLYISPLKALSNDIQRNLEQPLEELRVEAAREGIKLPEIRVAVRTGDTPASERDRMARRPPHILITTPESLYILLTAERSRRALSSVKTVVVDEIHAVAGDKRGAHLTLSLERLERLVTGGGRERPGRVGLSATQRPIERIGEMLVGAGRAAPRILDSGHARELDIALEATDDELGAIATQEQMGRVYDRIAELVGRHETTLVFVNTRRMVERVAHALEERLGADQVVAHHGSLSRRLRFLAEQKLKSGTVRCAVATASLELGIDVGSVDLAIQLGSPRSIATLLQRIGRSGHSLGATPKGRLFALTRDQLVECAALVRALCERRLDAVELRCAPLDVLAQQMVAAVACEELGEEELFQLIRGSVHYRDLERADFDAVLEMLSEGPTSERGRRGAHLHRDRVNGRLRPRRGARLSAITCGGAIPDNANYPVVQLPEEIPVGSIDEDFAIESLPGDVFLLGNTAWRIRRVEAGRVLVEDAAGLSPNIPFWLGEAPARTTELSEEISRLRADVEQRLLEGTSPAEIAERLAGEASMPRLLADQLVAYLSAARQALGGALPTSSTIVAERFFDDAGGMQLIIHSPLGGRINKAWGLALRKRFCRSFNLELQAAATDDGLLLSLGPIHSFPLEEVWQFLQSHSARKVLAQAVLGAPVFGVRWRWNVTRALAVLRRSGGKKVPPPLLRMRTDDLLSLVFPMQQACLENVVGDIEIPDHPLVAETMRDCLEEYMDADGLAALLGRIERKEVKVVCRENTEPSPLCHELVSANPYAFLDDAPLEERRTRAVNLPRALRPELPEDGGLLSPEAVTRAEEEASPPLRDADELHDALLTLILFPPAPEHGARFAELCAAGRATLFRWQHASQQRQAWVAAERLATARAALPGATIDPPLSPLAGDEPPEQGAAVRAIVRGHLELAGPRSPAELADRLGLDEASITAAVRRLEGEGALLRRRDGDVERFCDRRMLARIHRLTLGRLRREVEPVSSAALMRFLFRWQRVSAGAQLFGAGGLAEILLQLQGFETAAGAWEREILPARLHNYDPEWLDALCLAGELSWARLSRRTGGSAPTRAAPLALMSRADLPWLRAPAADSAAPDQERADDGDLGDAARAVLAHLRERGASFLSEIAPALGCDAAEAEEALWELVAAGLATADGFSCLRVLIDRYRGQSRSLFDAGRPTSRRGRWNRIVERARSRDVRRPRQAARSLPTASGRWSLLAPPRAEDLDPELSARQLLRRYGVVFRELLSRESLLPPWRELLMALRRLEARGEIRGGRFVAGFVGEQFALPEALEGLRALRTAPADRPELCRVAATDPLNLVGVTSPGPRVAAVIGNAVLYRNGAPLASLEAGEVVLRQPLEEGERIDDDLVYHGPRRRAPVQAPLPLL